MRKLDSEIQHLQIPDYTHDFYNYSEVEVSDDEDQISEQRKSEYVD